jgi:glycosyltransferase involved in cell wall biosynthesis
MGVVEGLLFRVLADRYVLTVHNLLPHDRHTVWNKLLFKVVYRIPHLLVAHTDKMKQELVQTFGVHPDRIVVMQHGLNDIVPDHGRTRAECRARFGFPADACVLLFFGRIRPYKGVETLLEAFGELIGEFFLLIVGAPEDAPYGRRIQQLVRAHPYRERIRYDPRFIDNAEVASYFRAADAVVMPYRHIDQSGVLFLAFRFELPVIAFDVGALREYINNNTGVLVEGGAAQEFAQGIRAFEQGRQEFRPDQIKDYTQKFRWAEVVKPLIDAYRAKSPSRKFTPS